MFPLENKSELDIDDDASENDSELKAESAALYGSVGFAFGGNNELLQSQFMLHTKAQKRNQIILLQVSSNFLVYIYIYYC